MALSLGKTMRSIAAKAPRQVSRVNGSKYRGRRFQSASYATTSFVSTYGTTASKMASKVSNWFYAAFAAPVAAAAFWGTSTNSKNDIETLTEDFYAFDKANQEEDMDKLEELAGKMVKSVRSMSDSELLRQPTFVPEILYIISSYYVAVGHNDAGNVVELIYSVARRIDAENKFPDVLRLAYKADFAYQAQSKRIPEAKGLLLKELDLLRSIEKTEVSAEQSAVLYTLAVLSAFDRDSQAAKYLEDSNKIFNGVTAKTLSADLEDLWRASIMNQLQYAIVCEEEGKKDMSTLFKTSAKTLYDAFKKVTPNKKNIPEYRELEVYARAALKKQREQLEGN